MQHIFFYQLLINLLTFKGDAFEGSCYLFLILIYLSTGRITVSFCSLIITSGLQQKYNCITPHIKLN